MRIVFIFLLFSIIAKAQHGFNWSFLKEDLSLNLIYTVNSFDNNYYSLAMTQSSDTLPSYFKTSFTKYDQFGNIAFDKIWDFDHHLLWAEDLTYHADTDLFYAQAANFFSYKLLMKFNEEGNIIDTLRIKASYNGIPRVISYSGMAIHNDKIYTLQQIQPTEEEYFAGIYGFPRISIFDLDFNLLSYFDLDYERIGNWLVAYSMKISTSGDIILGGPFWHENENFVYKSRILKVDTLGNVLLDYKTNAINDFGIVTDVMESNDGGICFANTNLVYDGQSSWGTGQVIKIDKNGKRKFITRFDTGAPIYNATISNMRIFEDTRNDGYVVVGTGNIPDTSSVIGYIAKIDYSGKQQWMHILKHNDYPETYHTIRDAVQTADGGYLIGGEMEPAPEYRDSLGGLRSQAWLVKVDKEGCVVPGCGDIVDDLDDVTDPDENNFKIYPNPVSDFLYTYQPYQERIHYQIYDLTGSLVYTTISDPIAHTFVIDTSDLLPSNYILKIIREDGRLLEVKRFIKP